MRGQSPPVLKTTTSLDSGTPTHLVTASRLPALYRKYGPLIYSRCRRILQDEALAQKATQEVFLRVLTALEGDGPRAVEALSQACETVCREFRRPQ